MKYSLAQAAQALCLALRDTESREVHDLTDEFIALVIAERLGTRPEVILTSVGRAWDEVNHDRMITITTAQPHQELSKKIAQAFPEAEITTAVDQNLKGGVVIKVGDRILDASIKTKLEQLQSSLSK